MTTITLSAAAQGQYLYPAGGKISLKNTKNCLQCPPKGASSRGISELVELGSSSWQNTSAGSNSTIKYCKRTLSLQWHHDSAPFRTVRKCLPQ